MDIARVLKIQQKRIYPLTKLKASQVLQFDLFILVNQHLASLELQTGMCQQQSFNCSSLYCLW